MRRMFVVGMTTALLAVPGAVAIADDAVDETELPDGETVLELSAAQMRKAMLIASYFTLDEGDTETDVDTEEGDVVDPVLETVLTLRQQTGWGAVYKLMLLAQADADFDVEELDGEWGFGKHFKNLTREQSVLIEDAPKNLGQLKKQEREAAEGERKAKPEKPGKGKKNG